MTIIPQIKSALENIYISPLELCNLNCRVCYTNKTKNILTNKQILDFVDRYSAKISLKSITFCGGEVFTLPDFTDLINILQKKNIFISIITNGTIDKLTQISEPHNCQLLVSFDGSQNIHDANRGNGNFQKSKKFVNHALKLGFPVEIMYLVTPESYPFIDTFNINHLKNNYITVKTKFFTDKHPLSANTTAIGLTRDQLLNIKRNYPTIPAKNFGCVQISLQSNGHIYGCCESAKVIGNIASNPEIYINNFKKSLNTCNNCELSSLRGFAKQSHKIATSVTPRDDSSPPCHGCCDPAFLCGYKKELAVETCQEVVTLFNKT